MGHYNYSNFDSDDVWAILIGLALAALLFFVAPFICFWLAYFGGWITKLVIGDTVCSALNILFNVTYFTPDKLPMMAGALGFIGGYFKSSFSAKKSDK